MSALLPENFKNKITTLSYKQRLKHSAELATTNKSNLNKVRELAKECLKQNIDSDSAHLSFTDTETGPTQAATDDDNDDWEMVVLGQTTNTAKKYSDHQVGIILAQCIKEVDLLVEALFSPSQLLKPLVIKHITRLAPSDLLYKLITGATSRPLPSFTIGLLHQRCISLRRVDVLDRLAQSRWRGVVSVNNWIHGCTPAVVRDYLFSVVPIYPSHNTSEATTEDIAFNWLVKFHPLTLVDLFERDLATTGPPEPTGIRWEDAQRPAWYGGNEERQKVEEKVWSNRRAVWALWSARTRTNGGIKKWIAAKGVVGRMFDILEKWPLAKWDFESRPHQVVFVLYDYFTLNLPLFVNHDFDRARNLILRDLSQHYTKSSFFNSIPWSESCLTFPQLMTVANDILGLIAQQPPPGDEYTDYRPHNFSEWTSLVFFSNLEKRKREQWLQLLCWTGDTIRQHWPDDADALTKFLRQAFEKMTACAEAMTSDEHNTQPRRKRFSRYHKMAEEILELLGPVWQDVVVKAKNYQDRASRYLPEHRKQEHRDIKELLPYANNIFETVVGFPDLGLRFHALAFSTLAPFVLTTHDANRMIEFGTFVMREMNMLFDTRALHRRCSVKQDEVDTICEQYLALARNHGVKLSSEPEFIQQVVLAGSERIGRMVVLQDVTILQWKSLVVKNHSLVQKLLCWTLPPAERAALVKAIVTEDPADETSVKLTKFISQIVLDALEPLRDLSDPTIQAEMQKSLATPNITSRLAAWRTLINCALLSQNGPALTWALTLLSGSRMANEPVMHRESILTPLLVPDEAASSTYSSNERSNNTIPFRPTVFQFYNTYATSLNFQEHARLWLTVFNGIINARDCPAITRTSLPAIVVNFQKFALRLLARHARDTAHPFFSLGLEIMWRIKVLEYGERKAGTEQALVTEIQVGILTNLMDSAKKWLSGLAYHREDRFGAQDEVMSDAKYLVGFAEALIAFFKKNVQDFANVGGKARVTQLSPLVNLALEDGTKLWESVPALTAVVERWIATLKDAACDEKGLLVWRRDDDQYDAPFNKTKQQFVAAMQRYNSKVAEIKKQEEGTPELHPLMEEFVALAIRSDRADEMVNWWRLWREVRQGATKEQVVTELLEISPSAIYLQFVVDYLVDYRQDLLSDYIASEQTFQDGIFYDHTIAQSNRGIEQKNRARSGRYKRMNARGGATFAAQRVTRTGALADDEDESIEYLLPTSLTTRSRALRFHHSQTTRLGDQILAIAKDRDATGAERLSGMKRYVHLPTTTYPDLVGLIEEQNKLNAAITEAEKEDGPPMPTEKPLPPNLVQELYLGFSHNDEPVAPLEFLLSPAVLKSDQARLAILNLQRVNNYIPVATFHNILKAVLSGERRKALRVGVHKQLIRLLADNPTDDNVKLILRECGRRFLHRDVRIELLDLAFKWLTTTNPEQSQGIDAGWKILERTIAIEDLAPETVAYLMTVRFGYAPSSGYFSFNVRLPSKSLETIQNFLAEKTMPSLSLSNGSAYLSKILLPLVDRAVVQEQEDLVYIGVVALRRFVYSTQYNYRDLDNQPYDTSLTTLRTKQQQQHAIDRPMDLPLEVANRCCAVAVAYLDWLDRTKGLHAEKPENVTRNAAGLKIVIDWFVSFLPDEQLGESTYRALHNLVSVLCTQLAELAFEDYVKRTTLEKIIKSYIDAIPICIPYTFGAQAEVYLMGLVQRVSNPLFDYKIIHREMRQFSHKEQTSEEALAKITSALKQAAIGRFLQDTYTLCVNFVNEYYTAKESNDSSPIVGSNFSSFVNLLIEATLQPVEQPFTYASSLGTLTLHVILKVGRKSPSVLFTCADAIRKYLVFLGGTKEGFADVLQILKLFANFIESHVSKKTHTDFPVRDVEYFKGTSSVVQLLDAVVAALPEEGSDNVDENKLWNQTTAMLTLIDDVSSCSSIIPLLEPVPRLSQIVRIIFNQQRPKGRKVAIRLLNVFNAIEAHHRNHLIKSSGKSNKANKANNLIWKPVVDMISKLVTEGTIDDHLLLSVTRSQFVVLYDELHAHFNEFENVLQQPFRTATDAVGPSTFQIDMSSQLLVQFPALFAVTSPAMWLQILVASTKEELLSSSQKHRYKSAIESLTNTLTICLSKIESEYKPSDRNDQTRVRFFLAVARSLYNTSIEIPTAESGLFRVVALEIVGKMIDQKKFQKWEVDLAVNSYNEMLARAYVDTNPLVRNIAWTTEPLKESRT